MGEETSSFMGVNLIKYVLLALVLLIAIVAVVRWTSSINKDELSFKADNSFLRLVSVVGKVEKNNMTSYTRVDFLGGEGVTYVYTTNYHPKLNGCKENKKCICVTLPVEGKENNYVTCKEFNTDINFKTNVIKEGKPDKTTSNCVGNNMYDCNPVEFDDEEKYVLSFVDVKISKDKSSNTINVLFTGSIK